MPPKLNKDLFNNEELKPVSKNNNFEDWINEVENASISQSFFTVISEQVMEYLLVCCLIFYL